MKKKFADDHAVACQVFLKVADVFEAFFPYFLCYQFWRKMLFLQIFLMYPNDEDFFIIRTVEDANFSALRQPACCPPEEIMVQFFGRRLFETGYLTGLRVYA